VPIILAEKQLVGGGGGGAVYYTRSSLSISVKYKQEVVRILVNYQLYNNLDSCGEYSLHSGIKSFSFIPQFTIVNAPI
jgi:hypothetical protein